MNTDFSKHKGVSLSVRGLRKSYNGIEVLKGIDFDVNAGEIFVIMGPSGSGKSVLLRQLIGLEVPDHGEVFIDGQAIPSSDITIRFRVAMVFQSGALLNSMQKFLNAHISKVPVESVQVQAVLAYPDVTVAFGALPRTRLIQKVRITLLGLHPIEEIRSTAYGADSEIFRRAKLENELTFYGQSIGY